MGALRREILLITMVVAFNLQLSESGTSSSIMLP
jgi:hypothetical protein